MSVIIYGNQICVWCKKAKQLAENHGLKVDWRDTDQDVNYNDLKIKIPEVKTIPQIWWNNRYIGGYDEFASEIENTMGGFGDVKF